MTSFVEALLHSLRQRREVFEREAAAGRPEDWASYQKLVGTIRGLELAEREVNDLAEKVKHTDE